MYAGSVDGALATTAVQAVIDTRRHRITYSSAGHPPAVLVHPDGTCVLLDQATDPPLGIGPQRLQAAVPYTPGGTLVLYTDGLIERRGEDIDAGLNGSPTSSPPNRPAVLNTSPTPCCPASASAAVDATTSH